MAMVISLHNSGVILLPSPAFLHLEGGMGLCRVSDSEEIKRSARGLNGRKASRKIARSSSSVGRSGNGASMDVEFPMDYSQLLDQARTATILAFHDNKQFVEIEFPTAGLESVPGDAEGGIEMTESMQYIKEYCDRLVSPEKASRTRVFFPEVKEVEFAKSSVFEGTSLKLDYLTNPSFFEDFGFKNKVKVSDHVKPDDELFLIAYPYFNVNGIFLEPEF